MEKKDKGNLEIEETTACIMCGETMLRVPFWYVCLNCGIWKLTKAGLKFYQPSKYEVRNEREKRKSATCLSAQIG